MCARGKELSVIDCLNALGDGDGVRKSALHLLPLGIDPTTHGLHASLCVAKPRSKAGAQIDPRKARGILTGIDAEQGAEEPRDDTRIHVVIVRAAVGAVPDLPERRFATLKPGAVAGIAIGQQTASKIGTRVLQMSSTG